MEPKSRWLGLWSWTWVVVGVDGSGILGRVSSGIGMPSRRTARGGVKGLVKGSVNVCASVGIVTDEVATDDDQMPEQSAVRLALNASMRLPIPFPICPSPPKLSRPLSSGESAPSTPQTLCHDLPPSPTLLDSAPPCPTIAVADACAGCLMLMSCLPNSSLVCLL